MVRRVTLLLILAGLVLPGGCGGRQPVGRDKAELLAAWLAEQEYSEWQTFKHVGRKPAYPASPDGLTLGSPNVFAAIGCGQDDLSSIDVLWCDKRTARPLAKPLTVHATVRGPGVARPAANQPVPLAAFPDQTLRRVKHTAIAVSDSESDGIRITCVDFAPMGQEHNFLCRWFLVENIGSETRLVQLALEIAAPGEWSQVRSDCWQLGDGFAVVSDTRLRLRHNRLAFRLGGLAPGERASAAALLVGASDPARLPDQVAQARAAAADLPALLEQTKADWESWCAASRLQTGDKPVDDLLDSLLCLVLAHIGPEAIHTGSLRYPHNRAWVRDSYWVQRALLELGRTQDARLSLDFFHRAWRESGIASYYEIPDRTSGGYGYHGVELPHYLVLMVRDAQRMAGVDGSGYWDMVQGCLDEAAVPPDGLQPMNGDETWLLAAPVRELDYLLDNSWLLVASAEYGAELAARMGDADRAARYKGMASRARVGINRFMPEAGEAEWFAAGRGAGGSLDCSLCPGVLARGAILAVLPSTDPHLSAGLRAAWRTLSYHRGIRTHPRSPTVSGGTPGYVLWAAADCPGCSFMVELAQRMLQFSSATGSVWEFHDMYDPSWGGEKRRLWDSAVLLTGLVHALFDVRQSPDGLQFVPRVERPAWPATELPEGSESAAPFDGEDLLAKSGAALVLHRDSTAHASRIAQELTRQCNRQIGIGTYGRKPPATESAIVVSRGRPPAGWLNTLRGYWVREWDGPPQLWVQNKGHVFLDTDGVLTDLFLYMSPRREAPLPFPDASLELAARLSELPPTGRSAGASEEPAAEWADLSARSLWGRARGRLDLNGGDTTLEVGSAKLTAKAEPDRSTGILKLHVSAAAPRPDPAELSVTLSPGWWLVYARDMTGKWDRVRDPVGEARLRDGRTRLSYSFSAGEEPIHLSFHLARLGVPSF